MKALLLLADSAQADPASGKLHVLGSGWQATATPTPPMSLLIYIDVPWDQTNMQHTLVIDLLDADGKPVSFGNGPLGDPIPAIHIQGGFEAGRPPGVPHGTPIRQTMAVSLPPGLPLSPGQKYEFHVTINGEHFDSWTSTFMIYPSDVGSH